MLDRRRAAVPLSRLVMGGLYRYARDPMYVAILAAVPDRRARLRAYRP
ncbi:hypothetical protein [Nonomuraea sp. NPDC005501]